LVVSRLQRRRIVDAFVPRKKRAGGMYTCRVQFQRPRIVVPEKMMRDFRKLSASSSFPAYDVCLSSSDCAVSMYYRHALIIALR